MQLTWRSRIGGTVGIVGALAVSCQGSSSGCITGTPAPIDPPVLLARYVLVSVQPQAASISAIPTTYDDSAGFKLRADADTLFFNADSTYREVGQTTLVPTTGSATVRPQATGTPVPRYTSPNPGNLTLPGVMGRKAYVNYSGQQLTVFTNAGAVQYGGPYFFYQAR